MVPEAGRKAWRAGGGGTDWVLRGGEKANPAGLNWAQRGAQTSETRRRWRSCFPEAPLCVQCGCKTRGAQGTVLAVEKPKPCSEQHEAARPHRLALVRAPQPTRVCSLFPIPQAGPGPWRLTTAAASCAGSPWLPPPEGCSAPGSGKSADDQEDWRLPQAHTAPHSQAAAEVQGL